MSKIRLPKGMTMEQLRRIRWTMSTIDELAAAMAKAIDQSIIENIVHRNNLFSSIYSSTKLEVAPPNPLDGFTSEQLAEELLRRQAKEIP